jgi:hypothetical protein
VRRWKIRALGTVLTGAMSLTFAFARADSDPMTFRGLRFGVDVRDQIKECKRNCKYTDYNGYCFDIEIPKQTCWKGMSKEKREPGWVLFFDSLTTALVIQDAYVSQRNGKLSSVSFSFGTFAFGQLESLFREKYGTPTVVKEEPWQSKGGVRTKSQTRVWDRKDLHIELVAPTTDIDHGSAVIATQESMAESHKNQSEQRQKLMKDL